MDEFLNSPILFQMTNLFLALIGVFGLVLNYQRRLVGYSSEVRATLTAWNFIFAGMALRGGWFFLLWVVGGIEGKRTFAQSVFYDYRIFALLISSALIGWGVISFYRIIERKSVQWAISILGGLIILSGVIAI